MNVGLSIRTVSAADWPTVIEGFCDLTYEHTLTYSRAAADRIGASTEYLVLEDQSGKIVAGACLRIKLVPILGRGIVWIAAGPLVRLTGAVSDDPALLTSVLITLKDHVVGAGHILRLRLPAVPEQDCAIINQAALAAGFQFSKRSAPYNSIAIDLSQDEDALMAGLHGKWRNPLRNALKSNMQLECGPIADLAERFHALYVQVQEAKGFSPEISPEFYYRLDGPDFDHEVLIARSDGDDVAGMTLGRSGTNGIYLFGATTDAGRQLNAGHFLMWKAIMWAKASGMHWLDLGGIDTEANPSVARFKQRTGGVHITSPGPYEASSGRPSTFLISGLETMYTWLKALR